MPFLDVLYPTGHKAKIELTNNTPLIKALEDACAKRGLDPTKHTFIHNRRPLELSNVFRLSGLVNHAAVQLQELPTDKTTTEQAANVRVCLRLENGQREEWTGGAESTIWTILEEVASRSQNVSSILNSDSQSDTIPVVMYLQDQIIPGETCLRSITLAKLGIRSGSALLHLHRRHMSREEVQKAQLLSSPMAATSSKVHSTGQNSAAASVEPSKDDEQVSCEHGPSFRIRPDSPTDRTSISRITNDQQEQTQFESVFSVFAEPNQTSVFASVGNSALAPNASTIDPPESRNATLGELLGINLGRSTESISEEYQQPQPSFIAFKFPTETEGVDLSGRDDALDSSVETVCDRQMVTYRRRSRNAAIIPSTEDVTDEIFEHTEDDIRRLLSSYRREWSSDAPLQTQAMRVAARERFYARYPRALIQFHWSDDVVVQACFKPRESVAALYTFVRGNLSDPTFPFHLYTTPPKMVLREDQGNLIQANLVPMAKIYFTGDGINSSRAEDVLRSDLLRSANHSELARAQQVITEWMTQRSAKSSHHAPHTMEPQRDHSSNVSALPVSSGTGTEARANSSRNSNVPPPKWLKLGK